MSNRFEASLKRLTDFVDGFIPDDMAADRELRKQARMFLFSHLFGPFIGNSVPAAIYFFDPHPTYDVYVLFISITAFWIFPFALRAFGRYNLMVLLSVQNLNFCILWSCYFYGGVHSPTLPWVLTIPLLGFFYIGPTSSLRLPLLIQFAVNVAIFAGAVQVFNYAGGKALPAAALQGLGMVSTFATAIYVTMMALYYAKILASGAELESETKQHLATATELRRATAEAERAATAKSEFLARMSHELRTPLHSVIGYSELLLAEVTDDGDKQSAADLRKIHAAGQHLLRLIEEILDLSKIEAGKMDLFAETVDLLSIVHKATTNCRALIEAGGNELVIASSGAVGTVTCDAAKVEKALNQLLDNAAKFTEHGRITVSVSREATPRGDDAIIKVRDTGVGIAPEKMSTLFEKFSVAEDSSSSKYGGTGLGLALTQRLCWLMGGELSIESQLGVGSCFTIRLPAEPPAESPASAPDLPADEAPSIQPGLARPLSYAA
jgi:signal transduction histidine kinase